MKHLVFSLFLASLIFSCGSDKIGMCPPGYAGIDCVTEVAPTSMLLKRVRITNFPATDGGAGWDLTNGPDVYIKILRGTALLYESGTFDNATPALTYNPNTTFFAPESRHSILLYDFDSTSGDDYMGGIEFTPYAKNAGFPTEITLSAGGISATLTVEYEFN